MAAGAGAYIGTGVATLWKGGLGLIPLTTGSLMLAAAFQQCSEQPMGENPNAGGPGQGQRPGDCWELNGCCGTLWRYNPGSEPPERYYGPAWKILRVESRESSQPGWEPDTRVFYLDCQGKEAESGWDVYPISSNYYLKGDGDCGCVNDGSDPISGDLPPGGDTTINYVDEETNCTYNLTLQGFAQEFEGGPSMPVWLMEGATQPEGRAETGGRMGGCNWPPVIVYDPGGGTGPYPPIPVTPGINWEQALANAAAGVAGRLLGDAISDLFEAKLPETEYELIAPCDLDAEGKQEKRIYELPEQKYQSRVVTQQAVIMEMLQQHLNWKTPTCGSSETPKGGPFWRSLSFESAENTDDGNRKCIKRFRYRSNSPGDVERLYEHWRDFVWNTGPVVVGHSGSPLGTPQVWASSVDEGQRVIQHAGREAGVDPDQVGKWIVSGSDNSRYGVSHTVKLQQIHGIWQATTRKGPSGYAEGVWTMPDP